MPFSDRTHEERVLWVESLLGREGIRIPPCSRFAQMKQVFLERSGAPRLFRLDLPDASDATESFRDYLLLEFVLENLCGLFSGTQRKEFVRRLQMVVSRDPVDPTAQARNTPGRDTMVELFLAALLAGGGIRSVAFGTPDVRALLGGRYFFVEAKRPRRNESILPAIEKAAGQVKRRGGPGAVFVDLSLAWNATKECVLRPIEDLRFAHEYEVWVKSMVSSLYSRIQHVIRDSPVGVVCIDHNVLRQVTPEQWRLHVCHCHVASEHMSEPLRLQADLFRRAIGGA